MPKSTWVRKEMIVMVLMFLSASHAKAVEGVLLPVSDPDTPLVYHPNQYFVEIDSLTPEDTILALLSEFNSTEVWDDDDLNLALWQVNGFPFNLPSGETVLDIDQVITSSKKKTRIRSATFNIQQAIEPLQSSASLSCFDPATYATSQGNETITISILDTGISDISDNSTSELNYNLTTYTGYDYVNNDPIPDDEHGHGSHVAGIIHSITHQQNPTSPSITFDIRKTHDSLGVAFSSNIVFAIIDAIDANADVINMSFSLNDVYNDSIFYPIQNAIAHAEDEGVLVVTSAGNENQDNDGVGEIALPASFDLPNIMSVGGYDCNDLKSPFSNYGGISVDIMAPSTDIIGPDLGQGVVTISGTSQATAIISAMAALKGSNQLEFDYAAIKCGFEATTKHLVDIADKAYSEGVVAPTTFYNYDLAGCIGKQIVCDQSFQGGNELTGTPSQNSMIETDLTISSSQIIQSQIHTTYDALGSIELKSGFTIENGALLQVLTNGCER